MSPSFRPIAKLHRHAGARKERGFERQRSVAGLLGVNVASYEPISLENWQRAFTDSCWAALPVRRGLNYVDLAESLLKDPGEEAIEALWRIGGRPALDKLVNERRVALQVAAGVDST